MEAGRQKSRHYFTSKEEFGGTVNKHIEMEALMKLCRWSKLLANLVWCLEKCKTSTSYQCSCSHGRIAV